MDLVAACLGRVDHEVQLEVAELSGRRIRPPRCDLGPRGRLRNKHSRDADDRHHQRQLSGRDAEEAGALGRSREPLTQARNRTTVVVEAECE